MPLFRALRAFTNRRASQQIVVPTLRLPTAVFPGHPISLPILEDVQEERPKAGALTPALAHEIAKGSRQIALLADGARTGVIVDVRLNIGQTHSPPEAGQLLHAVGRQRVRLVETLRRTDAGDIRGRATKR